MQAPDCVGQIERMVEQALRIVRCRDVVGNDKLSLGKAAALAENGTEAVKPVAFESDRDCPRGQRRRKSEPRKFRPAHDGAQALRR